MTRFINAIATPESEVGFCAITKFPSVTIQGSKGVVYENRPTCFIIWTAIVNGMTSFKEIPKS